MCLSGDLVFPLHFFSSGPSTTITNFLNNLSPPACSKGTQFTPTDSNQISLSFHMAASLSGLSASVTRILYLTGFPKELKTKDIQSAFSEYESLSGGFKIKWRDDTSLLIVFQDAAVGKFFVQFGVLSLSIQPLCAELALSSQARLP